MSEPRAGFAASPDDRAVRRPRRGAARAIALGVLMVVAMAGVGLGIALDRFLLRDRLGARHEVRTRAPFEGRGGSRGGPPRREPRGRGGELGMRARFAEELELSPQQAARVDSIMAQQGEELRRLRQAMQPRFDSALARAQSRLDSVLTPAQRTKLRDLRAREVFGPRGGFGAPERRPPPFR